jgi:hypothetical protein
MNIKEMGFESVDMTPDGSQTPVIEFLTNHFTNRGTPFDDDIYDDANNNNNNNNNVRNAVELSSVVLRHQMSLFYSDDDRNMKQW